MKPYGFVLAGGWSSRMGFDKARAPWHGWPMAIVVAETLSLVCGRVGLVRRGPPDGLPWPWSRSPPLEVLREADDGPRHPLWGVATALEAARTDVVLVVPCDVPDVSSTLLQALVDGAPAVAAGDGRLHPLVGAFPRGAAARARELAAAGAPVRAFASGARVVEAPAGWLRNVNTADSLPGEPLEQRLAFLPPGALVRALAGERARQNARGILAPTGQTGYRAVPERDA